MDALSLTHTLRHTRTPKIDPDSLHHVVKEQLGDAIDNLKEVRETLKNIERMQGRKNPMFGRMLSQLDDLSRELATEKSARSVDFHKQMSLGHLLLGLQ